MAKEQLPSLEYLNECFRYDDETGDLYWKRRPPEHFASKKAWKRWNTIFEGKKSGSMRVRLNIFSEIRINGRTFSKANIVWYMKKGVIPSFPLTAINSDFSDTRIKNLAVSDSGKKKGRCLPQGVRIHRSKYLARIMINGQTRYIGIFSTPEQAGFAYQNALKDKEKGIFCSHKKPPKQTNQTRLEKAKRYSRNYRARKKQEQALINVCRQDG